ncbi:MAG: hypothetical protein V3R86_00435 [Candidatus Hydrothermarchaeaceae archaeon]
MPRSIVDYTLDTTEVSKSVLIELMTALKSYSDALVLVGGWVPYFLLEKYKREDNPFEHIGSIDIDIAVDPRIVSSDVYATIVEIIKDRGYAPRKDINGNIIQYSFERKINSPEDDKEYIISVDFLSTQFEKQQRHRQVQQDLRARTMRGCTAVFKHYIRYELKGILPNNGETSVKMKIADVVGCITTKGIALGERYKEKDAYDIYSIVANYKNGPKDVAGEIVPFIKEELVKESIENIKNRFKSINGVGPVWVANFLNPTSKEEKERIMADAFMNVSELIRIVGEYR